MQIEKRRGGKQDDKIRGHIFFSAKWVPVKKEADDGAFSSSNTRVVLEMECKYNVHTSSREYVRHKELSY